MPNTPPVLDDDDEEEAGVAVPAPAPRLPTPQEALQENLRQKANEQLYGNYARQQTGDAEAKNQLYATLAKSAAQMGALGGQQASAAPVAEQMAGNNQTLQQGFQGIQQNVAQNDKARDELMKFLQQKSQQEFLGKKLDAQSNYQQGMLGLRGRAADAATEKAETDKDYKNRMAGAAETRAAKTGVPRAGAHKQILTDPNTGQAYTVDPDTNSASPVQFPDSGTGSDAQPPPKLSKMGSPPKPGAAAAADDFKYMAQIKGDKELTDARGTLSAISEATPLIDSATTNPESAKALAPVLARILSHGQRINMPEIESMEGGSHAVFDRIQNLMQTAASGTLTPERAAYLKKTLQVMQGGSAKVRTERESAWLGSYRTKHPAVADGDARTILGMGGAAPGAPPTPAAPPYRPSKAEALRELERRKGLAAPGGP